MKAKRILLSLVLICGSLQALTIQQAQTLVTNEQAIIANEQSLISSTQSLYNNYSADMNKYPVGSALYNLYKSVSTTLGNSLIGYQSDLVKYQSLLNQYQQQLQALQTPAVTTPIVLGPTDANIIADKPLIPLTTSAEYIQSYNHSLTGVEVAWAQGYTGKGVTVADIDTGISNINTDVNRVYNNPNSIIDFANIYNPTTKTSTKTQLSGGMLSDVVVSTGQTVGSVIPTVTISGNGSGATAVAIITNGILTGVQLTNPGNGYSGNVTVTVTNPSTGAVITSGSVQVAGYDYYGHGTATTAIMAGAFNGTGVVGVAFDANIIDVKVTDSNNLIYITDMVDGARAAYLKGATIMNQSIETYAPLQTYYMDGYKQLVKAGVTFVTAAGNQGYSCTTLATCNQLAAIPLQAGYSDMLTSAGGWLVVGALNNTGTDIASWSNRAGLTQNFFILAPGTVVGVASNNGATTVTTGNGTSYAAPYVAGAMALLQQKWPRLSGNQQAQILLHTADDMGAPGVDPIYGWGKIDLAKAFSPVGDLLVPNIVKNVAGLNAIVTPSAWNTSVNGTPLIVSKLASLGSLQNVVAFDSYQRDFNIDLTQNIKSTSNDFTFDSFMMVPVSKHFLVGISNEQNTFALGYRDEDYTFKYSYKDGLMGSSGTGALGYSGHTHYFGMSYKGTDSSFTGYNLDAMYSYGQAVNYSDSILNMSDIQAVSAKAEVLYKGFGVVGIIPNKVISGTANVTSAVSSDINGNIQYAASSANLANGAFQKDVGLEYRNKYLSIQATKSFDLYGIQGITSTDLKVNSQWYW